MILVAALVSAGVGVGGDRMAVWCLADCWVKPQQWQKNRQILLVIVTILCSQNCNAKLYTDRCKMYALQHSYSLTNS